MIDDETVRRLASAMRDGGIVRLRYAAPGGATLELDAVPFAHAPSAGIPEQVPDDRAGARAVLAEDPDFYTARPRRRDGQ